MNSLTIVTIFAVVAFGQAGFIPEHLVRSETKIEGPSGTITKTENVPLVSELRVAEPVVAEKIVENVPLVKSVVLDHSLPEIRSEVIREIPAVQSLVTKDTSIHGVDGSLIRKTETVPVVSDTVAVESVPLVKSALVHEPLLKSVIVDREIPATRTVIAEEIPATRTVVNEIPVGRTFISSEIPATRTVISNLGRHVYVPEGYTNVVSHGLPLNTFLEKRVIADDLYLRRPTYFL